MARSNVGSSQTQRSIVEMLREHRYRPYKYMTMALHNYLKWLSTNRPGQYLQYYNDLSEREIGVDLFDENHLETTFNDLQHDCPHIPRATVRHIINNGQEWLKDTIIGDPLVGGRRESEDEKGRQE
jgi:hypothetical protein